MVKEVLEPVDMSLCNLYFLYAKSSKNLEGQFEMYSAGPHPVKATSMHWTDHKIRAMGCVVEKFDLHTQHLQNVISTTANVKYRAKLEGETCKTSRCKVIVVLCPFHRCFSRDKKLLAEKSINDVVEAVKSTQKKLLAIAEI